MPTTSEIAATPRYFLLENKDPIGPAVVSASPENGCFAVYGFSGKPAYDRFVANSDRELRPYPLMKGYLQKQTAEEGHELRLVVLDAHHPSQQTITAVTTNSALIAQSTSAAHIDSEYQLNFDSRASAYRIAESST